MEGRSVLISPKIFDFRGPPFFLELRSLAPARRFASLAKLIGIFSEAHVLGKYELFFYRCFYV